MLVLDLNKEAKLDLVLTVEHKQLQKTDILRSSCNDLTTCMRL